MSDDRTASGLTRRTTSTPGYGPQPDGSVLWPHGVGRYYRRVIITGRHRHPDGIHVNGLANRACTGCILESEVEYLQASWRAALPEPRRRRWPGG